MKRRLSAFAIASSVAIAMVSCSKDDDKPDLLPPPALSSQASPITICDNGNVTLTASHNLASEGSTYIWKKDDVVIENIDGLATYIATEPGSYSVSIKIGDKISATCEGVVVTEGALRYKPNVSSATAGTTVGVVITVNNILEATDSYVWFNNGHIIPGATSKSYVATQPGNYTVAAVSVNGCNSLQSNVAVVTQQ